MIEPSGLLTIKHTRNIRKDFMLKKNKQYHIMQEIGPGLLNKIIKKDLGKRRIRKTCPII